MIRGLIFFKADAAVACRKAKAQLEDDGKQFTKVLDLLMGELAYPDGDTESREKRLAELRNTYEEHDKARKEAIEAIEDIEAELLGRETSETLPSQH